MNSEHKKTYTPAHPCYPVVFTANYICEEIQKNVNSSEARELISLILMSEYSEIQPYQKPALDKTKTFVSDFILSGPSYILNAVGKVVSKAHARIQAYNKWVSLVGSGRIWDHKKEIIRQQGSYWACDSTRGLKFMYDIWSNIHYGFVGRYVGFTEFELINGAGYSQLHNNEKSLREWRDTYITNRSLDKGNANILGRFDDPGDNQAIKVGFSLYDKFDKAVFSLTAQAIINEILLFYDNNKPIHVTTCECHGYHR